MGNSSSRRGSSLAEGTSLVVLSPIDHPKPASNDSNAVTSEDGSNWTPPLRDVERRRDALDTFNHPRLRRVLILSALLHDTKVENKEASSSDPQKKSPLRSSSSFLLDHHNMMYAKTSTITNGSEGLKALYGLVHSQRLLAFLQTAWYQWVALGADGRDPSAFSRAEEQSSSPDAIPSVPPLIPINTALPRFHCDILDKPDPQRPSQHVIGQVGFFCTDTCTPIFDGLQRELLRDAGLIQKALQMVVQDTTKRHTSSSQGRLVVYCLPTHPGHHAAGDSFGGYCYVNHVAALARGLQRHEECLSNLKVPRKSKSKETPQDIQNRLEAEAAGVSSEVTVPPIPPTSLFPRVAILDVDYHCGNGTASIFASDPSVLVVSLHCHPDYDYPFHMGFHEDRGHEDGNNTTLHLPLPPKTQWQGETKQEDVEAWSVCYKSALEYGLQQIRDFDPQAVLVSLGLDTYDKDPCTIRRAGFCLQGDDYTQMGATIAQGVPNGVPIVFVQEGGYRMEAVGQAAANVIVGCCSNDILEDLRDGEDVGTAVPEEPVGEQSEKEAKSDEV